MANLMRTKIDELQDQHSKDKKEIERLAVISEVAESFDYNVPQ